MADRSPPESVGFIWEQAELRIEAQLRQADAPDTKAGILVGLHAVAVGVLASALPGLGRPAAGMATVVIAALAVSGSLAPAGLPVAGLGPQSGAGGTLAIRNLEARRS